MIQIAAAARACRCALTKRNARPVIGPACVPAGYDSCEGLRQRRVGQEDANQYEAASHESFHLRSLLRAHGVRDSRKLLEVMSFVDCKSVRKV